MPNSNLSNLLKNKANLNSEELFPSLRASLSMLPFAICHLHVYQHTLISAVLCCAVQVDVVR
jgi:hypothetical protein